jgi:UDP-GlcNAc:undecaprenyl-phosphate GlcNAc-1-phosphate transferase
VAFVVSLLLFSPPRHLLELGAIIAGAGLLSVVGLLDDRYDLSWRLRFGAQFLAAGVVVLAGIQIQLFNMPLIDIPITLIWIVALTNATNFLDNMDGLTAGLSAIAAGFFLLIALVQGQVLVSLLAAAVLGSAIGFLSYNFNPASTFMGDMGALVLGFVLSIVAIKLQFSGQPVSVTWMVPIFVLVLPIFDINLVVWTRLAEGRSPTSAGRDHTSHRLLALGLSNRQTLALLYAFCIIYGALAYLISVMPSPVGGRLGAFGLGLIGLFYIVMIQVRRRYQ